MNLSLLVRLGMLLLLAGCTVVPNVRYHRIDSAADLGSKQFDAYSLQQNLLKLDVGRDAKNGAPDESGYSVTSFPAEYTAFKLGLTHADAWGVRTTLSITKRENTDLVKEVGSQVSDERVELIGKLGGFVSKAVGLATASGPGAVTFPHVVSALDLLEQKTISPPKASPMSPSETTSRSISARCQRTRSPSASYR